MVNLIIGKNIFYYFLVTVLINNKTKSWGDTLNLSRQQEEIVETGYHVETAVIFFPIDEHNKEI